MTTPPGGARDCSRAARFGVLPATLCSCDDPVPIRSPTTTRPVAIRRGPADAPRSREYSRDTHRRGRGPPGRPDWPHHRGLGIPEIGEHAFAYVLGEVFRESADGISTGTSIGAEHIAIFFGMENPCQDSRVEEVTEQDRQSATLGSSDKVLLLPGLVGRSSTPPAIEPLRRAIASSSFRRWPIA